MLPQHSHHASVAMPEAGHGAQDVLKHLPPSCYNNSKEQLYVLTILQLSFCSLLSKRDYCYDSFHIKHASVVTETC